jgi:hypothetical protein
MDNCEESNLQDTLTRSINDYAYFDMAITAMMMTQYPKQSNSLPPPSDGIVKYKT